MLPKVIAGNWKMHHGPAATRKFFSEFSARLSDAEATILIFPPAVSLLAAAESRGGRPEISLGIQNIHWEPKGAFTGEHSAGMALACSSRLRTGPVLTMRGAVVSFLVRSLRFRPQA